MVKMSLFDSGWSGRRHDRHDRTSDRRHRHDHDRHDHDRHDHDRHDRHGH
jgi:zinc transport system substrate-binding protein